MEDLKEDNWDLDWNFPEIIFEKFKPEFFDLCFESAKTNILYNSPGIYFILNLRNYMIYVGSSKNIRKRLICHHSFLKSGKHKNKHLQNSWNKHSGKFFVVGVLKFLENENDLLLEEQVYIDRFSCLDQTIGYNLIGAERKGNYSKETREKIGLASRGRKWTEERRRKIMESRTDEWKENNRISGIKNRDKVSPLNEKQVRIIKYLLRYKDMTYKEMGEIFDISASVICNIKKNKRWRDI